MLKLGDANTGYFLCLFKELQIKRLKTVDGSIIESDPEIDQEVKNFYKELLGRAAHQIPVVRIDIMLLDPSLNRNQQLELIKPVTGDEVYIELMSIKDKHILGCNGFNAHFFKKYYGH